MATYSSHRFIMGKWKPTVFFCLNGDILIFLMFIDMFFTFHKTFVQTAEFDWVPGRQKGLTFDKTLRNISSQKL